MLGNVAEKLDGFGSDSPAFAGAGGFLLDEKPLLWQEADDGPGMAWGVCGFEGRGVAGLGENPPLAEEEGVLGVVAEAVEDLDKAGEEAGMRVGVGDRVVDEIHQIGADIESPEGSTDAGVGVGEVPGGDGGEGAVGADDRDELALGEEFDTAGERGFFSLCPFGEPPDDAVGAGEEGDGLAGL